MILSQRTTVLYQSISNLKLKLMDFIANFSLVDNDNAKTKRSYTNMVLDFVIELIKYKPFMYVLFLVLFQFALYDFDISEYTKF
jgi:hypothetical protein